MLGQLSQGNPDYGHTLAAALLTAMVATGYVLWFVLPPGTNRTHVLWGLLRHQWGTMHFWISAALLAVLALHVALHWRWLVLGLARRVGLASWAERRPRSAGLAIVGVAAAPLVAVTLAAQLSVRPLETPLHALDDRIAAGDAIARGGTDDRAAAVLRARCAGCHGANHPAGGVRADTPAALLTEQRGIRWVVQGHPEQSRLLAVVGATDAGRATSTYHRIPDAELTTLRTWIAGRTDAP